MIKVFKKLFQNTDSRSFLRTPDLWQDVGQGPCGTALKLLAVGSWEGRVALHLPGEDRNEPGSVAEMSMFIKCPKH